MKKVLSLVIAILLMMVSLSSCNISIREVEWGDVSGNLTRDLLNNGEYIYTLTFQVRHRVEGLVIGVYFLAEDNEEIELKILHLGRDIGKVGPGQNYTYSFYVKDMTIEEQEMVNKMRIAVLAGHVVLV